MVQSFVSLSTWFIFFVYIEHLGEESLAIANLARNISGLPFMMVIAFASAASSIVSNMIGAGQTDKVALAIRRHIWLAYLCVTPLLLVVAAFLKCLYASTPTFRNLSTLRCLRCG